MISFKVILGNAEKNALKFCVFKITKMHKDEKARMDSLGSHKEPAVR